MNAPKHPTKVGNGYEVVCSDLTDRQREVCGFVADGETDKMIARYLSIEPTTVKGYVEDARQRRSAKNRTHLISMLWDEGSIRKKPSILSIALLTTMLGGFLQQVDRDPVVRTHRRTRREVHVIVKQHTDGAEAIK